MSAPREPLIITHEREQLAYLLTEAAEIEHGLMCCYLYAAFSLRKGESDGVSAEDARRIDRWRSAIMDVAIDEMLHLGLVSNLLSAIGSAPHFQRANFPVAPGYHPAGVVVSLAPFCLGTLDHFIYLERPEGTDAPEGAGFAHTATYERGTRADRLVPNAQDYATVGHLYRGIRDGFDSLSAKLGETNLFVGDPRAQVGSSGLGDLVAVTDLASARRAIDTIVEQGEGSPGNPERSHYNRFVAVRNELVERTRIDPSFAPAHPVARNPVMRPPPDPAGRVHIEDERAAAVVDLGNAVYGFSLRCLSRVFGTVEGAAGQRGVLIDASLTAMHVLAPVMELLATLPAGAKYPGVNAGLSFTMQRSTVGFSQADVAWPLLAERSDEIARQARVLAERVHPSLKRVAEQFEGVTQRLHPAAPPSAPATAAAAPTPTPPSAPALAPSTSAEPVPTAGLIEEARTDRVVLRFEGKRCIHSRHCVLDAPDVFLANVKGPWLHPEAVSVEELAEVAHNCPSGAITYERLDGLAQEQDPKVNVLRVRENGPLAVHAGFTVEGGASGQRATLCRCGASKNKPFCDGSHHDAPFVASGEPLTQPSEPLAQRGGPLHIAPQHNGPLHVHGNLEICSGTGRTVTRVTTARLCRCGGSANKPFCDGTHGRIGFVAD